MVACALPPRSQLLHSICHNWQKGFVDNCVVGTEVQVPDVSDDNVILIWIDKDTSKLQRGVSNVCGGTVRF